VHQFGVIKQCFNKEGIYDDLTKFLFLDEESAANI